MSDLRSFTDDALAKAMRTNDEKYRQVLRAMARRSFYFLTKAISQHGKFPNLFSERTFKARQDWLQDVFVNTKRGCLSDPRNYIKTEGCTIPAPVWLAIQVPNEEFDAASEFKRASEFVIEHPHLALGVNARYVLASDSMKTARKWTGLSKKQWELNPVLRWLFPEFVYESPIHESGGQWSNDGFTPKGRTQLISDPFLRPIAVDTREQGGRADGMFIDDLIGEQEYRSINAIEERKSFLRTITGLLHQPNYRDPLGGFVIYIGNRWTLNDVVSMIHEELDDWSIWSRSDRTCMIHGFGNCGRRKVFEDTTCVPTTTPNWPEKYADIHALEAVELDMGAQAYAAQRLNDPTHASELDESKLRSFTLAVEQVTDGSGQTARAWCVVVRDEAGKIEKIPITQLTDHLVVIDPAGSTDIHAARTAVSWFAYDQPTGRRFWLDARGDRLSPGDAIKLMYSVVRDAYKILGKVPHVMCEDVGLQSYVNSALTMYANTASEGVRIGFVEGVKVPRGETKESRQRDRVGNLLDNGMLYLRTGLAGPRTELRHWPSGTKDFLDTLVMAEDRYLSKRIGARSERLRARRSFRRQLLRETAGAAGVGVI